VIFSLSVVGWVRCLYETDKGVLGVHSTDAEVVEQATEVLRGHDPERVEQFDVEGARRL
jgi:hypothetical protein